MTPTPPRFPRRGAPESFGWLRVPALDRGEDLAWETPAGDDVWLQAGVRRLVQLLPSLAPAPDLAAARR